MKQRSKGPLFILILASMVLGGIFAFKFLNLAPFGGKQAARQMPPVLGALPEFLLTDQNGKEIGLRDLVGKNWVASFFFTNCKATCPAQTKSGLFLQEKLKGAQHGENVRLVFMSVDPEHDTPAVLREYAQKSGTTEGLWHFLTGPLDDVLALSQQGFKMQAAGPGKAADKPTPPAHSSQFVLVDAWGQIRGYYDGESTRAMEDLLQDLDLVRDEKGPSVTPAAESVARHDPAQEFGEDLNEPNFLRERQKDQLADAGTWSVFHDFSFTDRTYQSGITFRNRVVDDAAKLYKATHYDHGTGVCVADVDGDGLPDIYFVNQVGPCQLWRNLGGGKFKNITDKAGVGLPDPIKVAASFVDINNDGFPDLYVTTVRGGNHLFLNDGKGHFTDCTKDSGLDLIGHFSAPVFFDFDRDGLVDLFLCDVGTYTMDKVRNVTTPVFGTSEQDPKTYRYYDSFPDAFAGHLRPERYGHCLLLKNMGNARFKDVTAEVGLNHMGWTGDATPFDANGDGWPDLYVLNMQGNDEYYENQGGRKFVRKTPELFPKTSWGSMGAKVFDYNNDGKFDLFVTDMHSDMSKRLPSNRADERRKSRMTWSKEFLHTAPDTSIFGNSLFEAQAENKFNEVSDAAGVENYWPWGPSVADLNADGFQDVFITTGMSFPFRYSINSLLLNEGGRRFVDSEFVVGVEPRRSWQTTMPWFTDDAPNPNNPPATGKPPAGPVTVWSSLSSRSSVIFDLDDDGDLDIVTNEFNAPPRILISNLSERKKIHYLKIRLAGSMTSDSKSNKLSDEPAPGTRSNRDGLGAIVRVKCGALTYSQVNDGKSGYLSQSTLPLYFGLGDAEKVDQIEVVWPSGKKTLTGPTDVNKLITIIEKTNEP